MTEKEGVVDGNPRLGGITGTSLVVQWLRLHASNTGGLGSIPGWGAKILHAVWCGQKKKKDTE